MKIEPQFNIGDTVFLKSCPDQFARIVTGIMVRSTGLVYELSFVMGSSNHYDFEILKNKDTMIACGIEVKNKEE